MSDPRPGLGSLSVVLKIYSESKYSVELLSCRYLKNWRSDQRGDFSVEFRIEKLTTHI